MHSREVRTALMLGSAMALCGALFPVSSAFGARDSDQKPTVVRAKVGATTAVPGKPGDYRRVLFAPPDAAGMLRGAVWEIGPDVAVTLARLPKEERWAAIRRSLALPPEEADEDVILWGEVVDTIFDMIGTLQTRDEGGPPAFGVEVAFPLSSNDPSAPQPEVALTLNKRAQGDFGSDLTRTIAGDDRCRRVPQARARCA